MTPNLRKALPKVSLKQVRAFETSRRPRKGSRVFSVVHVEAILAGSSGQLRAMVLLGINGGFGNTDCSERHQRDVDLDLGMIDCHRTKTGIKRVVLLGVGSGSASSSHRPCAGRYTVQAPDRCQYRLPRAPVLAMPNRVPGTTARARSHPIREPAQHWLR